MENFSGLFIWHFTSTVIDGIEHDIGGGKIVRALIKLTSIQLVTCFLGQLFKLGLIPVIRYITRGDIRVFPQTIIRGKTMSQDYIKVTFLYPENTIFRLKAADNGILSQNLSIIWKNYMHCVHWGIFVHLLVLC